MKMFDKVKARERKRRAYIRKLKEALVRAVRQQGHDYHCSAARGMESDCHCGWVEVKALAKSFERKPK